MSSSGSDCACCKAKFIKFRLTAKLTCDDYRQTVDVAEFWDGDDPNPSSDPFYVYNLSCEEEYGAPVKWAFHGDAGWVGLAVLDDQNISDGPAEEECFYRIIELLPCCAERAIIRFSITSANVEAGTATANILAYTCGISSVQGEVEGSVTVVDALECFFTGETNTSLVGRKGYATYMGDQVCQWEIINLCC